MEQIKNVVFAVGSKPRMVWGERIVRANEMVLRNFDPDWFVSTARLLIGDTPDDRLSELPQDRALGVRLLFHHSLETCLSFLFALLQAPTAVPAWLALATIRDLRELVEAVNVGRVVYNTYGAPRPSWEDLAGLIEKEPRDPETIRAKARAWKSLASEFLERREEYNEIKHGFRAIPTGIQIRIGSEKTPGETAKVFHPLGGSQHGTATNALVPVPGAASRKKTFHYEFEDRHRAWTAESTVEKLELLAVFLRDIRATALVIAGTPVEEAGYAPALDPDTYAKPWKRPPAVTGSKWRGPSLEHLVHEIDEDRIVAELRRMSGLEGPTPAEPTGSQDSDDTDS